MKVIYNHRFEHLDLLTEPLIQIYKENVIAHRYVKMVKSSWRWLANISTKSTKSSGSIDYRQLSFCTLLFTQTISKKFIKNARLLVDTSNKLQSTNIFTKNSCSIGYVMEVIDNHRSEHFCLPIKDLEQKTIKKFALLMDTSNWQEFFNGNQQILVSKTVTMKTFLW